ncbi:hypothetical protein D5S17_36180 [Pseudonocardiaceae bacterium YIM PH 21723]|nr:hypothetical protein D5S17_36180 [Pseudonocardiaceae bacterium YIM PH 21723]
MTMSLSSGEQARYTLLDVLGDAADNLTTWSLDALEAVCGPWAMYTLEQLWLERQHRKVCLRLLRTRRFAQEQLAGLVPEADSERWAMLGLWAASNEGLIAVCHAEFAPAVLPPGRSIDRLDPEARILRALMEVADARENSVDRMRADSEIEQAAGSLLDKLVTARWEREDLLGELESALSDALGPAASVLRFGGLT